MACASVNEPVRRNIGLTRRQMAAALAGITAPVLGPGLGRAAARPAGKPSPQRTPVSAEAAAVAEIPGMPGVRLWADRPDDFLALLREAPGPADASWLALSGGGQDGAYGAGVLAGWTASGTRPDFAVVTGVSTGALIAPYAFLGPRYDEALKHAYTTVHAADVFEIAGTEASLFSTWPLRDMIAREVTPELLLAVAAEHRRGRRLFVLTTNIDAGAARAVEHGSDRRAWRARGAGAVPKSPACLRQHSRALPAGHDRCPRPGPALPGDACRWLRERLRVRDAPADAAG